VLFVCDEFLEVRMHSVAAISGGEGEGLNLGEFVRGAMHDIANPLNGITMNCELAKVLVERGQPERALQVLENLLADCARCARVVRGMQRFGSGLYAHSRDVVRARAVIDAAIALVSEERTAAMPQLEVEDSDAQVSVDTRAMERAIAGLIHNSAEAGATKVQIGLRQIGDQIEIVLNDNGAGIAAELRSKVCEPFFTTRRSEGASGLGLTLACELVRAHGGELRFDDDPGVGTQILVRLPQAGQA
jgi:C4-dicarboxylate-specific signal transduction histidine kinase